MILNEDSDEQQTPSRWEINEDRIIGGHTPPEDAFPYIVSLRYRVSRNHICGGTIILSTRILTAAHCIRGRLSSRLSIAAGQYYLNSDFDDHEQIRNIATS